MANQPATPSGANIIAGAMAEVIATDPDLKSRISKLARRALREAEWVLDHGDPAAKNTVIRTLLPAMVKESVASDDEQRLKELESLVSDMRTQMMSGFGALRGVVLTSEEVAAAEDQPRDAS